MQSRVWRAADGALLADETSKSHGSAGQSPPHPAASSPGGTTRGGGDDSYDASATRLADGALLRWPWQSYTNATGWSVSAAFARGCPRHAVAACRIRRGGSGARGDYLAALSADGSVHLAPFAPVGELSADSCLAFPVDQLVTAAALHSNRAATTGAEPATALANGKRRHSLAAYNRAARFARTRAGLAASPDGSMLFTAQRGGLGGSVLVWRVQAHTGHAAGRATDAHVSVLLAAQCSACPARSGNPSSCCAM